MAKNRTRNYSVYIGGKKVGSATGSDYSLESGDELQVGDGEVFSVSEGVITGTLSLNSIVPIAPTATPLILAAFRNKQWIQLGVGLVDGKIHKLDARCKSIRYSTQMANGTLTGAYEFIFGEPETT